MIRQVLAHYPHALWSVFAMLLFVSVFIGACVWVFRPRSREQYAALEQAPLTND